MADALLEALEASTRRACEAVVEVEEQLRIESASTDEASALLRRLKQRAKEEVAAQQWLSGDESLTLIERAATAGGESAHSHSFEHHIAAEVEASDSRELRAAIAALERAHDCSERRLKSRTEADVTALRRTILGVANQLNVHRAAVRQAMDPTDELLKQVCSAHYQAVRSYHGEAMKKLSAEKEQQNAAWRALSLEAVAKTTGEMRVMMERAGMTKMRRREEAHARAQASLESLADALLSINMELGAPSSLLSEQVNHDDAVTGVEEGEGGGWGGSVRGRLLPSLEESRVSASVLQWRCEHESRWERWLAKAVNEFERIGGEAETRLARRLERLQRLRTVLRLRSAAGVKPRIGSTLAELTMGAGLGPAETVRCLLRVAAGLPSAATYR